MLVLEETGHLWGGKIDISYHLNTHLNLQSCWCKKLLVVFHWEGIVSMCAMLMPQSSTRKAFLLKLPLVKEMIFCKFCKIECKWFMTSFLCVLPLGEQYWGIGWDAIARLWECVCYSWKCFAMEDNSKTTKFSTGQLCFSLLKVCATLFISMVYTKYRVCH